MVSIGKFADMRRVGDFARGLNIGGLTRAITQ